MGGWTQIPSSNRSCSGQYSVACVPLSCQITPRFYRRRDDGTNEGRAIFCRQKLVANYVEVVSDVASGNVLSVQATPDIVPENEVTGGRDGGRSYNGCAFSNHRNQHMHRPYRAPHVRVVFPATTNPFIQFRANATNSIVPAAIFRSMSQQQGGLASVFSPDRPNAVLDWTQKIYVSLSTLIQGYELIGLFSRLNTSQCLQREYTLFLETPPFQRSAHLMSPDWS
jgi:hypothetical protein